jgi:nitrate/TMAO reductase-like tetraheme cytochrome c subunit
MFAVIFHWWLGALLTIVGVLLLVSFVVGYIKFVVSPQYPGKRNKRDD